MKISTKENREIKKFFDGIVAGAKSRLGIYGEGFAFGVREAHKAIRIAEAKRALQLVKKTHRVTTGAPNR